MTYFSGLRKFFSNRGVVSLDGPTGSKLPVAAIETLEGRRLLSASVAGPSLVLPPARGPSRSRSEAI